MPAEDLHYYGLDLIFSVTVALRFKFFYRILIKEVVKLYKHFATLEGNLERVRDYKNKRKCPGKSH